MIIRGGENLSPVEIETFMREHPCISDVAVIGVPSEQWGEAVHAVVVLRDGADADEAELIAHCRSRIAGYKVPRSIDLSPTALPKSGPGKVLKRELRAPYWEGRDRSIS